MSFSLSPMLGRRTLSIPFLLALCFVTSIAVRSSTEHTALAAPGSNPMRVLVPAYFYPLPGSPWVRLIQAARQHPGRIAAIGDPFNGPGPSIDPTYVKVFHDFRAAHGKLFGYVYTSYGQRPLQQVLADVDTWYAWYGVDGIFVDEMDNVAGAHESYYQAIRQHVLTHDAGAWVIGNPGTNTLESYLEFGGQPVVSTLCVFENFASTLTWSASPWMFQHAWRNFCAIGYKIGAGGFRAFVDHAYQQRCGWTFVTDDDLPNPYDTLPNFFEAMLDYIELTHG